MNRNIAPQNVRPGMTVTVSTTACATPGRGTVVEVTDASLVIRFDAEWSVRQDVPFTEVITCTWEIN